MTGSRRTTRRHFGRALCAGFTAAGLGARSLVVGQQAATKADGATAGAEDFKKAAGRYRITLEGESPQALALVTEPVLRWTNPLRKTSDGSVFLWLAGGRPEVVASFYRYGSPREETEDHEFQSLATAPLTATRDGQVVWSPPGAGVVLAPVLGAPAPADSPAARLRQMRALAREFKAFFDLPENRSELRQLTQPLYRYEPKRPDLVDGAIFAYVQTTDPEVLLLIEARRGRGDAPPAWQFALARMSMVNLRAEHKGREVWKVDWVDDLESPGKPYLTIAAPR